MKHKHRKHRKTIIFTNVCGSHPGTPLVCDAKTLLPVDPAYGWYDCNGRRVR